MTIRNATVKNSSQFQASLFARMISAAMLSGCAGPAILLCWSSDLRLAARIVNYADDFVILCPRGRADAVMAAMRKMMERLKLTVNEQKTHMVRLPGETFDFLGYTFGRLWDRRTGKAYYSARPSQKALKRLRGRIHEETSRQWLWKTEENRVAEINRMLIGWANYFSVGSVARAYGSVDFYVFQRLRQWWCAKHGAPNRRDSRFSCVYAYQQLGLTRLVARRAALRVRTCDTLSESRMRENCTSGSMSGSVETEHGQGH